jgi:hypothetical protein
MNNNINEMVEKYLPNNEEAIKSAENLKWVEELCSVISNHYQMGRFSTDQGTIYSKHGYNVHYNGARTNADLYFRVEHFGVELNNDKVIHKNCDEELVKKVVDFSTKYFKTRTK